MTVCIQCAMRALIKDEEPPFFEETAEAHLARCHADLEATRRERAELQEKLRQRATRRNHDENR